MLTKFAIIMVIINFSLQFIAFRLTRNCCLPYTQVRVFKEDFDQERRDREQARTKMEALQKKLKEQSDENYTIRQKVKTIECKLRLMPLAQADGPMVSQTGKTCSNIFISSDR
jgi:septal ring factor EnvC (AmiA/AmiB activator)